jgi:DNA-directed RNA polymerase subunit N (RpoN/RPB10)
MTCGSEISSYWNFYVLRVKELQENNNSKKELTIDDLTIENENILAKHFDNNICKKVLDDLEISSYCCRRHFLSTVDLIEII